MDSLGAEVSAKIRSAIKAKLIELEAYVDDELPDYIMVMVANNRTRAQMEDDLGLFLNNNTAAFTNWLHAVLEKLKKVTLEEVSKKDVKKKKPKKTSDKLIKKSKDEKVKIKKTSRSSRDDRKRSRSPKVREKKTSGSSRPAKPPPRGGGMDKSSANANMEELGTRRKKKSSTGGLDSSGGTEGYNPASLLKSALSKTKDKGSPKKSLKKSSGSVKKEVKKKDDKVEGDVEDGEVEEQKIIREIPKTIINLKEETGFYAKKERDKEVKRGRSRSRSPWKGRSKSRSPPAKVASLVSKVVRPDVMPRQSWSGRHERRRSRSQDSDGQGYDPEKELRRGMWSRAQIPPRPKRPVGREEVGVARAVGRAIMEADRSIVRNRKEDPRDRDLRDEVRGWDKTERNISIVSPDEELREDLKRRHEEAELRMGSKDERQRVRDLRDRSREEVSRIEGKICGPRSRLAMDMEVPRSRLAMDQEVSRSVRSSSLDRKLLARREENRTKQESGDMRIIVRRELTPEPELEPEPVPEPEPETVTPPKKIKKMDDEDAELLDMRRKALESLMKRTDQDLLPKRSSSMERRIRVSRVQDMTDSSSSESDDTTDDSEISDMEAEKKNSKPEPTFVVTLDGLDDKYFKSKQKGVLELARERIEKPQPVIKVKKAAPVEEPLESKYSSEEELELHPNEDFDDLTTTKKVVHKTAGQDTSDRPVLKVAGRKRSPILASGSYKTSGSKKVAAVRPVVAAQPVGPSPARLAAGQAAKLTAMRETKVSQTAPVTKPVPATVVSKSQIQKCAPSAHTTQRSAPPISKVATTPKIKTQKIITAAKSVTRPPANMVSKTSVPVAPKHVLVTPKPTTVPAKSTVVRPRSAPATTKPLVVKEEPAKTKVKRIPITAPTPDPVPTYTRFQSAPSIIPFPAKTSQTVCRFWPACVRKDSCAFYHPPPPKSAEAILSTSATVNKFKWSAK